MFGFVQVFTGAATCFYAFIGFDIIATTGEEAHSPQKSIPKAIVGSLVIVLIAYVSSSLVLTLVVPYDHIDAGSALVQMWSYVGAKKCQALVAIGATAGEFFFLFIHVHINICQIRTLAVLRIPPGIFRLFTPCRIVGCHVRFNVPDATCHLCNGPGWTHFSATSSAMGPYQCARHSDHR